MVCFVFFFYAQTGLGIEYTWTATSSPEWNESTNWTPSGIPNTNLDTAITGEVPSPVIGYLSNSTIDLSILKLPSSNAQTVLGRGSNTGILNLYGNIQVDAVTTQITLENGTLNFQSGFSGNTGSEVSLCAFAPIGSNTINFLPGSTGGSNMSVVDYNTTGVGGTLNIQENITLGALVFLSPSDTINISAGKILTGANTGIGSPSQISGRIRGDGGLNVSDVGIMSLSGSNTYTGGTTVSSGRLTALHNSALGSGSVVVSNGSGLQLQGGITTANSLTLNGTGGGEGALLNVSGNNTYSGPILLNSATTIGSTAGTLTLSNTNAINGFYDLTFTGMGNTIVSGTIGMFSGGITKTGYGTLTLSGANIYSFGTAVNEGVVNIQNNTALGSGPVTIVTGAQLQLQGGITVSNIVALNGTGEDAGALLNVSGDNTWSSGITLGSNTTIGSTAGTLTLSSGVVGAHDLVFTGAGNITVNGAITTSANTVTKNGAGTLTLGGSNTYSGGTILNGGILSVSSSSNIGGTSAGFSLGGGTLHSTGNVTTSGAVGVTANSVINTDSTKATTLSGTLTGSGEVTLTLSGLGTNSLSTVQVNNSNSFTIAGVIGGSQVLTKTGTGTLILNGSNTYTGGTVVSAGRLSINGGIIGGVGVNVGATLGGTGIVYGGGTINGTLSPGNSIGNLTFDTSGGNLILDSASTTNIEIDPSSSSEIVIVGSGSAILGGTLHITQNEGVYGTSGNYEILTGNYTGAFQPTVTGGLPGYQFRLSYTPGFIYLLFGGSEIAQIPIAGLSGNDLVVANYLNGYAAVSTLELFDGLTGSALQDAMRSVSPSRNAFGTYIAAQMAFSMNNIVSTHMDSLRFSGQKTPQDLFLSTLTADNSEQIRSKGSKNRLSAWVSGFGEFAHQSASLQNPSFYFVSEAALMGLDYQGDNRGVAGGSLGYAHTHYSEDDQAGHGNINYYLASFYGNGFVGNFYFSPAVWGIFNQINHVRNISFSQFSETAHADIFAWQFIPHLEVGYDAQFSWGDIIPFTSADWAISWQRGYREHGASPFNAKQKANHSSMVKSETGLKFCEKWEYGWGGFFLKEKISYIFEKPFGMGTVNTSFLGTPGAFTVAAVNQNLNLGSVGLNFLVAIGKDKPIKLDFGYEGEFGSNYWANEVMLTISKSF
ncbi:MAG: autotransporter domain-containing protein [Simkaniaceae bacterium]|nr:autotransporter domain-containing protein [Simkaniaceae bacterium]